MFNLRSFITCVFVFISKSESINVIDRDAEGFLETFLRFYGENKSISTENLDNLLLLISARRSEIITDENPLANQGVST